MKLRAASKTDLRWLEERVGSLTSQALGLVVERDDTGDVAAAVAYDMWTPASAQVHLCIASRAAGRLLLKHAFAVPFVKLGRRMLLASIPAYRAPALQLAWHLGFVETHRVTDGWDTDVDLVCLEMRRENCPWIKGAKRKAA